MTDAPADAAATAEAAAAAAEAAKPAPTVEELVAQLEEWKGHARKHEDQAKANKTAAAELAELKRSTMSDAEKAAADAVATSAAVTEATSRAEKAEAALLRKTIAVDLELSKEDAAVLDGITGDEAAIRAVAERLAGRKSPGPKPNRSQGLLTGGTPSKGAQFADALGELFST